MFMDMTIHDFDMARFLAGSALQDMQRLHPIGTVGQAIRAELEAEPLHLPCQSHLLTLGKARHRPAVRPRHLPQDFRNRRRTLYHREGYVAGKGQDRAIAHRPGQRG